MSFDPRRERYLEEEIVRLQESKLATLRHVRTVSGREKVAVLDHFLEMDAEQKKLETELQKLQDD